MNRVVLVALAALVVCSTRGECQVRPNVVALKNGPNTIDLTSDGIRAEVFVARRENHNAHSFTTVSFFVRSQSGENSADSTWLIIPFIGSSSSPVIERDMFSTVEGADCTLSDLRLVRRGAAPLQVIIATRAVGKSYAHPATVRFDTYVLEHDVSGEPGVPPWYFKYNRSVRSQRAYCDVNEAFDRELAFRAEGVTGVR